MAEDEHALDAADDAGLATSHPRIPTVELPKRASGKRVRTPSIIISSDNEDEGDKDGDDVYVVSHTPANSKGKKKQATATPKPKEPKATRAKPARQPKKTKLAGGGPATKKIKVEPSEASTSTTPTVAPTTPPPSTSANLPTLTVQNPTPLHVDTFVPPPVPQLGGVSFTNQTVTQAPTVSPQYLSGGLYMPPPAQPSTDAFLMPNGWHVSPSVSYTPLQATQLTWDEESSSFLRNDCDGPELEAYWTDEARYHLCPNVGWVPRGFVYNTLSGHLEHAPPGHN